ncbi:hypothetical protein CC78DRAFT_279539 [Lojkania enalia]|uniref:C2H2-type domain-containing protein n=1 Tax=Lojkania enalia TaxID=147567 RepID=A0A9P4TP56_9PLEO|nr:hypothetical protein CC78DRAFT_279539 [Didymosphaeria enalia]
MHSVSTPVCSQHDAELPSLEEEPHPGTRVNTDVATLETLKPSGYQGKQNNPSKQYLCPFCAEYNIDNGISRESDLVRHFRTYHNTNILWICRRDGCGLSFDLQSAYKLHVNNEGHRIGPRSPGKDSVLLQPQVVFACGFDGCKKVYEVNPLDPDATQASRDYFSHVMDHMKKINLRKAQCPWDEKIAAWSYSTRMYNLLRQSQVRGFWKGVSKEDRRKLSWKIESSTDLRKKLECRDVKDAELIIESAQKLGSQKPSQNHRKRALTLPTLDDDVVFQGPESRGILEHFKLPSQPSEVSAFGETIYSALEAADTPSRQHVLLQVNDNWAADNPRSPYVAPLTGVDPTWAMHHPDLHAHAASYTHGDNTVDFNSGVYPYMTAQWIPTQTNWYESQQDVAMGSPPR